MTAFARVASSLVATTIGVALTLLASRAQAAEQEVERMDVPGQAPAYFVAPTGKGKKPVVVWVHARSGDPRADCAKWGKLVSEHAWLLCPSGPEDRGNGARGWNNSWTAGKVAVDAAFGAFRKDHGKKLAAKGHALIGFSEGAFVAMNVGVREPETFSRWLILAASDHYWGADGFSEMRKNKDKLSRVYLLTGEKDGVVDQTRKVFDAMDAEKVKVRLWTPDDIGHEVPGDRMRVFYRKPLRWLFGLDKSKLVYEFVARDQSSSPLSSGDSGMTSVRVCPAASFVSALPR